MMIREFISRGQQTGRQTGERAVVHRALRVTTYQAQDA